MPFITLTNVRKHLILNSMAGKVLLSVNRVRWRLHLCAIWCILVDYSCSCRDFQIWSFTLCRTKQAALADSRSHYMYPPLLSTTLISCPHSSTSLVFCDGGGVGGWTDKAASSEITYHSSAMCSAVLSEKCQICQSSSTEGNMWAVVLNE